jgi:hypothetical protein
MIIEQFHSIKNENKIHLLRTCLCLTRNIEISELDHNKSWARQRTKKSLNWILKNTDVNSGFIFFGVRDTINNDIYLDIAYRGYKKNEASPDYFIFLRLEARFAGPLAERFGLTLYNI